jgi:hypothetical protein
VPTASWEVARKLKEQNPSVDYRPYPLLPNYVVGSNGEIYSACFYKKNLGLIRRKYLFKISPAISSKYLVIVICQNKKRVTKKVHSMVAETFLGPKPKGKECAHGNGKHTDNRVENLRWATRTENLIDRLKHKTNPLVKLTYEDSDDIRLKARNGVRVELIAREYGVCKATIYNIISNLCWKN